MGLRLLFACVVLNRVYGDIFMDFIVDYFGYKQVPSIVGYSCQTQEEDVLLLKNFSQLNIRASIYKIGNNNKNLSMISQDVKYSKLGVFIDFRCQITENSTLLEFTEYRMYGELHNWLIIADDLEKTLNLINDEAFGLSTDFVIAIPNDLEEFELYDVYNFFKNRGTEINISNLGTWNRKTRLNVILTQPKNVRRANLHGLSIKIAFYKAAYKPADMKFEDYLQDYQQTTRDGRSKFGYHLLKCLSDMHNFSIEAHESLDWQRGDPLGPLTRSLINNTADIIGTPFTMTGSRTFLIKYIHQDWRFRTCLIFRSPQPTNIKVREIFRPLANMAWYLMIITLTIGLLILSFALYCDRSESDYLRLSDSFLIIAGALCQQSTDIYMSRLSTRIIFLFLMIFSLLMYNYYSASVVSARLDEPIVKINDSLNEFVKMNMKFSSEWIVYMEFFFKSSEWEIQQFYKKLWLKLPESKRYMPPETGLKMVKNGGFAYHLHPDVGYPYIEKNYTNREICELMEVHLARPSYTAFGVTINSPIVEIARIGPILLDNNLYTDLKKNRLTKISEVGLRKREENRWQYKKPNCRKDILNASSITMDEFSPHLILLVMGIILSIMILVFEITISKYFDYRTLKMRRSIRNPFISSRDINLY